MTEIERLREALEAFQSYGCPVCHGDCASANPPVMCCPMQQARAALSTPPAAERGEWQGIETLPDIDHRPSRQFIIVEGWKEHSGVTWARTHIGMACVDLTGPLGYRRKDIDRIREDGDMDGVDRVSHWMPATFPHIPAPPSPRTPEGQ